jgi:hypothetical protein
MFKRLFRISLLCLFVSLDKSPAAIGGANHDNYTILILVNFTLSDIEEDADEHQC